MTKKAARMVVGALALSLMLSGCSVNISFDDPQGANSNGLDSAASSSPDDNLRADLSNIAFAQEFRLANTGSYADSIEELVGEDEDINRLEGSSPRLTLSEGAVIWLGTSSDGSSYVAVGKSESGGVLVRSSGSGEVFEGASIAEFESELAELGIKVPSDWDK